MKRRVPGSREDVTSTPVSSRHLSPLRLSLFLRSASLPLSPTPSFSDTDARVQVAKGEPAGCFCATRAQLAAALGLTPSSQEPGCCTGKAGHVQAESSPSVPSPSRTRVIVKAAGPGSTQASQGFSLEQLLGRKANPHPEGSPLFSSGKMRGAVHREPAHWTATAVCGVFIQMYVLREKSKVLQPCTVYILKENKSFVCFYYFNYCYKKPAIFNMWFGEFCLFFLFGVFLCFVFVFVLLDLKKEKPCF